MNHAAKNRASRRKDSPDLKRTLKLLRRENRLFFARTIVCGVCWFLAVLSLLFYVSEPAFYTLLLSLLFLITGAILIGTQPHRAVEELTVRQDARAVAPLLDALAMSYGAKTKTIQSLLILLLPQMTFADALLLNRSQWGILWDALEIDNQNDALDYPLAVLAAWENIGNQETVRRLNRLLQRGAITQRQLNIKEAAKHCLLGLEARLAQEKVSGTLLRAASPYHNPNELLHSVQMSPDTEIETLLQPVNRPAE